MVHKKYENPKSKNINESNWYDRAPPLKARNYLDEMAPVNGVYDISAEQSARLRESFRDEVSKRMGELLLRGQTMLDVYCETCSGILMEDRSGVRRCVTCEVYREKTTEGSRVIAEVPLDNEDFQDAPEARVPQKQVVQVTDVPRDWAHTYADYDDLEETNKHPRKSTPEEEKIEKKSVVVSHKKVEKCSGSNATSIAKSSINSKIQWAAERLEKEKDTKKIIELLEVLKLSAETLVVFSRI